MILCSPSPGTEPSERITLIPFQPGSDEIFLCVNARRKTARRSMNGVPGVITLESNGRPSRFGGTARPSAAHSARSRSSSSSFSCASCAERKRRERCWFIFARGATPSIAMYSSLRGRTAANTRSK